ncbi:MAG: hypothetical protein HKO53_13720, partial [Gemmatimonadetes bacterium]|nr:hypothetical protein [Gemmatimonadota bacterium]
MGWWPGEVDTPTTSWESASHSGDRSSLGEALARGPVEHEAGPGRSLALSETRATLVVRTRASAAAWPAVSVGAGGGLQTYPPTHRLGNPESLVPSQLTDPLGALAHVDLTEGPTSFYRLGALEEQGLVSLDRLPFSIRILLENALRCAGDGYVTPDHVATVANWDPAGPDGDVPFMPSRVVLQDFTGVPAVVDLASMRNGLQDMGGDPQRINPLVPADLVIDHSVQVDYFGSEFAFEKNVAKEFERNRERYALLRWAQEAFENFRVVPPGTGIVHQVNLEYLASVIHRREEGGVALAYPDTLVGTDSHTTMINGLGVVGWGV